MRSGAAASTRGPRTADACEHGSDVGVGRVLRRMCAVTDGARALHGRSSRGRDAIAVWGTEYYRTKFDARLSNAFVGERATCGVVEQVGARDGAERRRPPRACGDGPRRRA